MSEHSTRGRKPSLPRLRLEQFGPIKHADVAFGDLTVVVGPQATGKSLFLQALKLYIDQDHVHDMFARHSMSFSDRSGPFLDAYFGKGMSRIWRSDSVMEWGRKEVDFDKLTRSTKGRSRYQKLFYIPAQRVMSLPGGVSQNFGTFNYGDPYTLRAFSDAVHDLIQNEFGARDELFPAPNRLNAVLRRPIEEHLFGGKELVIDHADYTKRLALKLSDDSRIGFLSWSAGQREFTPMLMGLYWLCTTALKRKSGENASETIDWVVIEEPEMGLHPRAIQAVLLLVLELLRRGYRVVVSTHSPVVLEMVWALSEFQRLGVDETFVRDLFSMPAQPQAKELSKAALKKRLKVYYFDRMGSAQDISGLNPFAEESGEADWGGLVEFATHTNDCVATAVNKAEADSATGRVRNKLASRTAT